MINGAAIPSSQLVTIFGGAGFLGRHVVRALAKRGYRIRVAVRRPYLAGHLQPLGDVGQIALVQANVRSRESVDRAVAGSHIVINLVGILQELGRQKFIPIHQLGARIIAEAASAQEARLIHVSALGASKKSPALYAKSKALGEETALDILPEAIVFRPSVLFGPEDAFFNRFAALARILPIMPLVGADTKFQPVFVGDVAEAIARAVDGNAAGGRVYELGGPEVKTLRELIGYVLKVIARERPLISVPYSIARIQAAILQVIDKVTFGLLPQNMKLTKDQVELLQADNIVSEQAIVEERTLEGLGIKPTAYQAILPAYLWRFRKSGQFGEAHI